VRLSRAHAATLYAMVQKDGVLNTSVTLTGSSQIALARNPKPRAATAVARRAPAPQYDAAGDPVVLTPPQTGQYATQARADDGYIYPADGSADTARYPAPRSSRRVYDAQAYQQPQYQSYDNSGYAAQGNGQRYYQPRGMFGYQN
jgi:hypothetical protein